MNKCFFTLNIAVTVNFGLTFGILVYYNISLDLLDTN
jgi:hypothetical protein